MLDWVVLSVCASSAKDKMWRILVCELGMFRIQRVELFFASGVPRFYWGLWSLNSVKIEYIGIYGLYSKG